MTQAQTHSQGWHGLLTQMIQAGVLLLLEEPLTTLLSAGHQKEQRPVQMMCKTGKFPRAKVSEVRAQVLELPYVGQELSMVLVLPDEGVDLSTVRRGLGLCVCCPAKPSGDIPVSFPPGHVGTQSCPGHPSVLSPPGMLFSQSHSESCRVCPALSTPGKSSSLG